MALAAMTVALALVAGASEERLLLCRPRVEGDAALARAEALPLAARHFGARFLDYGVPCEDAAEGARAARRAGLAHAVAASAEGRTEGSRFVLTLATADGQAEVARRTLEVAPGAEATRPLRDALAELLDALPRAPASRPRVAPWVVAGAGAAALAAGVALAASASDAADRANAATAPEAYTAAREEWRTKRAWSGVAIGAGAAALAAGLAWRFAF
jgi:hypothetical protein